MSRSFKKNPAGGMCSTHGQKLFRSNENRAKRRKVNQLLQVNPESELPHEKEYGNEWASPRDGHGWWGWIKRYYLVWDKEDLYQSPKPRDMKWFLECMRK